MALASRNTLIVGGLILAALGGIALYSPSFNTTQNKNVATIGNVSLTANEQTSHQIPSWLGAAGLIVGLLMIGGGALQKRG